MSHGIRLENVRVSYGKGDVAFEALRGISMTVAPGELTMIRGPSGSGKTTLLQVMGALLQPNAGRLWIGGSGTAGLGTKEMRRFRATTVGFIFQAFNLFPALTAWENVAVALDLVGWNAKAAELRSRSILADLGLGDRADHRPAQLSGGQRQRVAIARALAHDPPVILADEPTAALDGKSGAVIVDTLRRLAHERGRVVVVVSHDARVEPHVDRIVDLEDGALVEALEAQR